MLPSAELFPNLAPVVAVTAGALVSLASEPFLAREAKHKVLPWIAASSLVVAAGLLSATVNGSMFGALAMDPVRALLTLVLLLASLLGIAGLQSSLRQDQYPTGEGYALMLLSTIGSMTMVMSTDLISLFVGMELSAIPVYALVALRRNLATSQEGAFKYLITGGLFGAAYLYGAALYYGATGSTQFAAAALQGRENLQLAGIALVAFSLLFKAGAAPLHFWVADVYAGASTPVTGFMGATVKIGAFTALGAFWLGVMDPSQGIVALGQNVAAINPFVAKLAMALAAVGLLSIVLGSFSGLVQNKARRMMGFSAIVNAGFLALGLLVPAGSEGGVSLSAMAFYLATYAIGSAVAMAGLAQLTGPGEDDDWFERLRGSARRSPILGAAVSLALASLAGLPPVAGFLAKFQLLAGLAAAHLVWVAAIALVLAVVAAAYYLRLVAILWNDTPNHQEGDQAPALLTTSVLLGSMALLALTFVPSWFGRCF